MSWSTQKRKHGNRAGRRRRKFGRNGGRFHNRQVRKRNQRLADDRRIARMDRYAQEEVLEW